MFATLALSVRSGKALKMSKWSGYHAKRFQRQSYVIDFYTFLQLVDIMLLIALFKTNLFEYIVTSLSILSVMSS